MGSGQSTPSQQAAEQLVIEQLRSMRMQDRLQEEEVDKEYIHINNDKVLPQTFSVDPTISPSQAEEWEKQLLADPKNRLALNALLNNSVDGIVGQPSQLATTSDAQIFNVRIPFEGSPVTNQRSSGRCW